ncbi:MAG: outer membrane lipid asymmetry maintenance protein MlaD [Desulfocapsaceae bacterium]|jgi:phospholipid/cholesterol/gamma-HCH transport system substrate-binding protein|nr:outer membrane lipid asymmetry maintenance protein MlaD [Desulfocapsaceae bacterium]
MKKHTLEMVVGLFMVLGFAAIVYLALNLGEVSFLDRGSSYFLDAEFDNISGIKKGATVQIAGVVVGEVSEVMLNEDSNAQLTFKLDKSVGIPLDSIASVKSQGIIGDKYIQISLGGDLENFEEHGLIVDTESAVDIESLISKFAFGSAR